jgi:predicted RNA-binding Zn-ribbon protein involved in translation (DUF1610 family)
VPCLQLRDRESFTLGCAILVPCLQLRERREFYPWLCNSGAMLAVWREFYPWLCNCGAMLAVERERREFYPWLCNCGAMLAVWREERVLPLGVQLRCHACSWERGESFTLGCAIAMPCLQFGESFTLGCAIPVPCLQLGWDRLFRVHIDVLPDAGTVVSREINTRILSTLIP